MKVNWPAQVGCTVVFVAGIIGLLFAVANHLSGLFVFSIVAIVGGAGLSIAMVLESRKRLRSMRRKSEGE